MGQSKSFFYVAIAHLAVLRPPPSPIRQLTVHTLALLGGMI